jgi:TatD DNase family protein
MLVDSHCHLDLEAFDADRDAVLQRAHEAGVAAIVNPGIGVDQCRSLLAMCDRYPSVFAAVGVHPNSSGDFGHSTVAELAEMTQHPSVVAIGEIGLDYYWKSVEPQVQRRAFQAQLELAAEAGKPVIIHCREANDDVADVLARWVASEEFRRSPLALREFAGVLHAFSGDAEMARNAYEWGFVISLGGPVTFRNAHALHTLAPQLRLDRLMLETDAPYLTPHPFRGQRNEPAYVALVCRQLASLLGVTEDAVAQATTAVAARFFALESDLFGHVPDHNNTSRSTLGAATAR